MQHPRPSLGRKHADSAGINRSLERIAKAVERMTNTYIDHNALPVAVWEAVQYEGASHD